MTITIAFIPESSAHEKRVAVTPDVAVRMIKLGLKVVTTPQAGINAGFTDESYVKAGVELCADAQTALAQAHIVACVNLPDSATLQHCQSGTILLGLLNIYENKSAIASLRDQGLTSFALEFLPRISRAQSMDALSSQASAVGYQAVIIAADHCGKFFPMLTTAAGTVRPATVLVIGAGVAGLQAIATARRLGAIVEAYDVRPETKEQIESLGARFVDTGVSASGDGGYARDLTEEEKDQQQEKLAKAITRADCVVTTAAIPGRPAPKIISKAMIADMRAGSVIVDIAADSGGNAAYTKANKTVITDNNVRIIGAHALPSRLATHASEMYGKNILNLITLMITDAQIKLDWQDEILAKSVISHDNSIPQARIQAVIEQ